jgi:hypothetical protein
VFAPLCRHIPSPKMTKRIKFIVQITGPEWPYVEFHNVGAAAVPKTTANVSIKFYHSVVSFGKKLDMERFGWII